MPTVGNERHRFLETILNNTKKLNKLVYELFELSKLDANQIKPKPESFSLSELAQDVILKFEPYAEEKQIKIQSCLPEAGASFHHIRIPVRSHTYWIEMQQQKTSSRDQHPYIFSSYYFPTPTNVPILTLKSVFVILNKFICYSSSSFFYINTR